MIKKILYGLLGLIIVLTIVGFFLPGKLELERSMVINAPAQYAFEEVDVLQNWNKWSYWNTLDPNMKVSYSEQPNGVGAYYSWESEQMGPGKLNITESVTNSSIKADLDFIENGTAKAWYNFQPESEGTKVTMGFASELGMNPLNRWRGVFMKSVMNTAFEHNLTKLKEIAEAKPKFSVDIADVNVEPMNYISIQHTMSPQDQDAVNKQMEKMYTELYGTLAKSKVESNGKPFCIYPKYSEESMDMICAVPVPRDAKLGSKYKISEGPGGRAIKATHLGNYATLTETYQQLDKYVEFRNLEISGAPWEVYVTDPTVEKDTAKWVTEVYYPVRDKAKSE
jgi:effector-binding domain-containing protein